MLKFVNKFLLTSLLFFLVENCYSQQTTFEEKQTLYASEMAGGVILHTSGWGINFIYAEHVSGFSKRVYEASLIGMKHEKEIKTLSDYHNIRGYFYGKLNSLTILRTSIGAQNTFLPKQSLKGVAISINYSLGISHGFTKPVYLAIGYSDNSPSLIADEIRDEKYDPQRHFPDNILGRSPIFKGYDGIKYHPGLYAKFGLNFEYSNESDLVRAIEAGVTVDAYLKAIPMMAFNKNIRVFPAIYFNFIFGKKKQIGEQKEKRSKGGKEPNSFEIMDNQ